MNVNGFLGSSELTVGGDDQCYRYKHEDSAEDQSRAEQTALIAALESGNP